MTSLPCPALCQISGFVTLVYTEIYSADEGSRILVSVPLAVGSFRKEVDECLSNTSAAILILFRLAVTPTTVSYIKLIVKGFRTTASS